MARTGGAADFPALLAGAQRGEPGPLRLLYDGYAPAVAGYLRSHGAREVEDLTSEVFLAVLTRLPDFSGTEANFRSFVFTVAHHRLVDEHRRRARRPDEVPFEDVAEVTTAGSTLRAPSAETEALTSLGTERVRALLADLSADQRDVLLLRLLGDLTVDQVAEVLGKRRGAVKALQRRGLAAVARALAAEGVTMEAPRAMTMSRGRVTSPRDRGTR